MSSSDEELLSGEEEEEQITDLRNSDVVTKYQEAAKIVNLTAKGLASKCTEGTGVVAICTLGNQLITKLCQRIFKSNKKMEKGLAFPTCVSVNEVVCHFSPLDDEDYRLKNGDVVKLDLAAHIDGYIATVAHTLVVGAGTEPVTGPAADVLAALDVAQAVMQRLCINGGTNAAVSDALKLIATDFQVSLCQGVLSHQMKRFVIDGNKVVIGKEEVDQKVDEVQFETNEVYALDVVFSTGDGKPRPSVARTTVFKRALDVNYKLKRKSSRYVFGQVPSILPFTLRVIEDATQAKAGVIECVKCGLLAPYPVLAEKAGSVVGHAKMTVLVMPSGTTKITGNEFPVTTYTTDKVPGKELQKILAMPVGKKKRKKKKKKKKSGGAAKTEATAAAAE